MAGPVKENVVKPRIAHILIIVILGFLLYSNSFGNQFVYDDDRIVVDNIYVKNFSYLPKVFTQDLGAGAGFGYSFYRPLQTFTYMVDHFLWGLSVFGYHLTNIILHILVAVFLYLFILALYKDARASLFASILFIVHPAHVEAVTYISGRADLLVGLGIVAFFTFYLKYISCRKPVFFGLSLLCYVCALLSKEYAVILPALVLLYHYTFKEKIKAGPAYILAGITLIYIVLRTTVFSFPLSEPVSPQPFFERLTGFFAAITQYVRIIMVPLVLHMEYGKRVFAAVDPIVLFGFIIFLAAAFLIYWKRGNKPVFFSLCWLCICLIPVSNLYPINAYMAEHWLYIPSMGLFAVAGYSLGRAYEIKNARILVISAIVLIALFFGWLTIRQNLYWKEPISFYERTLKYTDAARIYNNLGNIYADKGDYDKSIATYEKAIASDPKYTGAYSNLGNLYNKLGRMQEAVDTYRKAIEVNPGFADAYNNLGTAYDAMGYPEEAMRAYREALKIRPDYSEVYSNVGNISYRAGDVAEAIKAYQKAVEINPYNAVAYYNLSKAYRKLGNEEAADDSYRRAKELDPQLP